MAAISVGVRITGLTEARALLGRVGEGASTWQRTRVGAGSDVPYAYWIEEGRYFGGRPGRTTPIHYLARALADVLPTIGPRIVAALPKGGAAISAEATKISQDIVARAQGYVTVRSGRLRGSIRPNRGQGLRSVGR